MQTWNEIADQYLASLDAAEQHDSRVLALVRTATDAAMAEQAGEHERAEALYGAYDEAAALLGYDPLA